MAWTSEFGSRFTRSAFVVLIETNLHRSRMCCDLNVLSSWSSSSILIVLSSTTREYSYLHIFRLSLTIRSRERPTPIISIDEPSPDNLLQFRSRSEPSKMRFTKETFRDSTASSASAIPDAAFDAVIEDTLKLERSFGSDDSSDDLPDPSQIGTSQRSKKSSHGKRRASSDRESQDEEDAAKSSESEEELMKEDEEIDKFVSTIPTLSSRYLIDLTDLIVHSRYPFYCLAKVKGRWWPATCVGAASNGTNGNKRGSKAVKKFKIEYSDGSKGDLARSSLLLLRQRQFQTVRVSENPFPRTGLTLVLTHAAPLSPAHL